MQETSGTAARKKESYKLYVEVGVVYMPDGNMAPQWLRLTDDGEIFRIDRIYRHERAASRKAGGCGICYFVRIRGQDAMLFYEDAPDACRWFVETKRPLSGEDAG